MSKRPRPAPSHPLAALAAVALLAAMPPGGPLSVACAITDLATDAGAPAATPDVLAVDASTKARIAALLEPAAARDPDQIAAVTALLEAIAAQPAAPIWLAAPLGRLLSEGPAAVGPKAAAALGSIRTRESFRVLLHAAIRKPDTQLPAAAYASMARLTGRTDLGADGPAWERLYGQVQWLPEAEWRGVLTEWLSAGIDQTICDRDAAIARLAEMIGAQLQAAPDAAKRYAVLGSLLSDPSPPLQRLGLSLSLRELANARPIDPKIAEDTAALLAGTEPLTRRLAAQVLSAVGAPTSAPAVLTALESETDPQTVAELLSAASRWPRKSAVPIATRWLTAGEPAAGSAIACLLGLSEAGLLDDPALRTTILDMLRAQRSDEISVPSLRLLLALGDVSDRARVSTLLASPQSPARMLAAEAMSRDPNSLDALLAAARGDPALAPSAAQGLLAHRINAAGFAAMLDLLPASDDPSGPVMLLASRLPLRDMLQATQQVSEPALREAMLARALAVPTDDAPPEILACVRSCLLALASARLELRQPAQALKALDALPLRAGDAADADVLELRGSALLRLGRLDAPELAALPPAAWLQALERSMDQAIAPRLIAAIEARFAAGTPTALAPDLQERFNTTRARVEAFVGPAPAMPGTAIP